jgi:hypothetical protein
MADAPKLTVAQLRAIVVDAIELAKGARLADDGDLSNLARHERKLFADAAGTTTYKVQAICDDKGWRARCSCMAARSRPFCKHAAGLLVAWQRDPEAFAVSDAPPPGTGDARKKRVKTSKVDAASLMARGVLQVMTLVRELAVAGAAAVADDRAGQVRVLGENLREHRLRRLSAKTIALADLLDDARGDDFDEEGYTELLGDLLLTARKLERHIAGEPLADHHVEELIGKTWTKKDRRDTGLLDLVEIAFLHRETPDGFTIRESRFVDAATGQQYAEKQILPGFLARRTPAKPSHAGTLLRGAHGGLYPGYAPRRTDLEHTGAPEPLTADTIERVARAAVPSVKAAIAALAEHKKDVFAPERLPVIVACDMVIADRGRLQLVDRDGAAIFLADDARTIDRFATALAGSQLEAVIGDLEFDGALPTLVPLALIVAPGATATAASGPAARGSGPGGARELRSIAVAELATSPKIKAAAPGQRRSRWAMTARGLGLSTAAIALGEIREEIAGLVFAGLASVTARRIEPMAVRLDELGLGKQAELLRQTAAKPDAAARLDDVIKLHQVLALALARLAGALQIDRTELAASAMFPSVYVRKDAELQPPHVIARRLTRGEINRFEAGALAARHYDTVPALALIEDVFPAWADGSASPFIALAARRHPEVATAVASSLLVAVEPAAGAVDPAPALAPDPEVARLRNRPAPRMAAITALRVLEAIGGDVARGVLGQVASRHRDVTLRSMARAAIGRLAGAPVTDDAMVPELRGILRNAGRGEDRARAADRLADAGAVAAIPLLRQSFAGDVAAVVRDAAGRALGRLGDADSVDSFCAALHSRDDDRDAAKTAAYALGYLGDVRAADALVAAYEAGWLPDVIGDALTAIGRAAAPLLVDTVERNPELLKRATARRVFDQLAAEVLEAVLVERLDQLAAAPDFVSRASVLLDVVKHRGELAGRIAAHILRVRPDLPSATSREARALARKADARGPRATS